MKKELKKMIASMLALVLVLSMVVTGCSKKTDGNKGGNSSNVSNDGNKGNSSNKAGEDVTGGRYTVDPETPAWKLDTKEDNKLTWYVNADWWYTGWGEDPVTRTIKEDLKLDVEFITGDDTKLNTLFAGEDLPDIISIFGGNSATALAAAEWAFPLNELADKYDPYFYKVAKADTLSWYKLEDGNTYGYPNYSNSAEDYAEDNLNATTAFIVRKDVYEALGQPKMGTPEEFINVLTQIKAQFPDLIPFGFNSMTNGAGSLGYDFQNFIGVPIENTDGTWYDRDMDGDYLTWLRTFNHAYQQGLISDDRFATDGTTHEEMVKIGSYATIMVGGTPQLSGPLQIWMDTNPDAAYIAIDGPQSTVGNTPTLSQSGLSGWTVTYITKECKDPIKAIQLYTYLLADEGGILATYGVEGETFAINADGKYEFLPEVKEMQQKENDRFKQFYRLGEFLVFNHDRYLSLGTGFIASIKQMQDWGKGKLKPFFLIDNIDPEAGSLESRNLSTIYTNWGTTIVGMLRAENDAAFDQTLETYKKFRQDNGWDGIIKVRNEKMTQNREKLGLK